MSGAVEWYPKTTSEFIARYADFTDELASGETLVSATTAASVWSGNDSSPAIINNTTVIENTAGNLAVAEVTLQAGVLGTIYLCVVSGITSQARTITKAAVIAVKPPYN